MCHTMCVGPVPARTLNLISDQSTFKRVHNMVSTDYPTDDPLGIIPHHLYIIRLRRWNPACWL